MNPTMLFATLSAACLLACDGGPQPAVAHWSGTASATDPQPVCRVESTGSPLPAEVRETSGLARSRRDPDVFWTHNDAGNGPELFAIGADGILRGRVRVEGVESRDWEDLEAGACGGGTCLYIGDIGDNDAARESITVYEIAEPDVGAPAAAGARAFSARFPDGPRDAEALFALPSGDLYVVTKGRESPIALYRFPAPRRAEGIVTLERVREIGPRPENSDDRVTAATASPDGRWIGIRTYRTLLLYPATALTGSGPAEPTRIDLSPLQERQGESLVIGDDGSVWLTSEAEDTQDVPRWARLRCSLPGSGE